ncbi:putative nucleolar protein 6 [Podospora fimiseda]|uniref:U3 small nucleolar RNA-associated protein 22 n=1 Tax=Podospora fimiseda TaxID=252190 RepID=A0AAN7BYJ7_9PEZI|nr:putative nucleolar protein 6 [Podospora fimiseda]
MDSAPAKRRKLDHSQDGAEKALQTASTVGVSRSRAFVLETEELLQEVRLDYGTALEGADDLLYRIKGSIEAIKSQEPLLITQAASKFEKKHKIKIPFPNPQPPQNSNYKLAFEKPAQFNVVGSYVSKTMVKTQKDFGVDMVVVIPQEILQEKDYLDLRYFYKRAYYLAAIAATIQKEFGSDGELSYEHLNGNPLLPILALQPTTKEEKPKGRLDYKIRIIPCAPEGFFPKSKLHLGASLLRKGRVGDSEDQAEPTAFYNSTLAAEGSFLAYLKLLRQTEKKCKGFKNACILGRTWLQQRGFGSDISKGGFGHVEWAVLLALLLQPGGSQGRAALSTSLSSTQLFRAMIQFLDLSDLSEKPLVFGSGKTAEDLEEYLGQGPILYDCARQVNIAFKMGPWSAALLHQHAKWTRALLDKSDVDQFAPTFIIKADLPFHTYDLFAHLNYSEILDKVLGDDTAESRGRTWQLSSRVYSVLKRALADKELGERARLINIKTPGSSKWALTETPKSQAESELEIGILFDPQNMARTVDKGPTAGATIEEREECENFRNFWGEKAELRRFERDTIRETLVWGSKTPFGLCEEIMRYILSRHLRIGNIRDDIDFYGNGLDALLSLKPADAAIYHEAKTAFSTFEHDIRSLEDLPLRPRQIAPICPELRHASVKPPALKQSSKSGPRPMDCIISFEASGKWPESVVAIQRTKIAFLLMIGNLLEKSKPGQLRTHVGMEDAEFETQNLAFLDVVYESGAAFRLRIHSDLEEALLERQVKDKTVEQYLRQRATAHLAGFRRLYTNLPLHNQTISTAVTRFPALSPTIRLVKHWFSCHKLSNHFTEEFVELVCLHVFFTPYPWDAPSSASTGFVRVLLFLARWDWRSEPLIVAEQDEISNKERQVIGTRLEAWRKIDPTMSKTVLVVATPGETSGIAWTGEKPGKVVATRMTVLARGACQLIREEGVKLDWRRLFVGNLKEYDVLIHLDVKAVKECLKTFEHEEDEDEEEERKKKKYKNLDERVGMEMLPVGEHPSDVLLGELERVFNGGGGDGVLVFFRGGAEEDGVIGGVWNPLVAKRKWRVVKRGGGNYMVGKKRKNEEVEEEEGEEMVEVNREAVLSEIARVGGGLIERVEVKN